jgi:Ni/Fe-hydrogenase subunit HybB-like protein
MIVGGVAINRINVFIVAYTPPVSQSSYFPALGEILVTVGLISALMFTYRFIVTYLPVLSGSQEASS